MAQPTKEGREALASPGADLQEVKPKVREIDNRERHGSREAELHEAVEIAKSYGSQTIYSSTRQSADLRRAVL